MCVRGAWTHPHQGFEQNLFPTMQILAVEPSPTVPHAKNQPFSHHSLLLGKWNWVTDASSGDCSAEEVSQKLHFTAAVSRKAKHACSLYHRHMAMHPHMESSYAREWSDIQLSPTRILGLLKTKQAPFVSTFWSLCWYGRDAYYISIYISPLNRLSVYILRMLSPLRMKGQTNGTAWSPRNDSA